MSWEFNTDRPIYSQIVEQIKQKIITQEFKTGTQLPSVRELASIAGVNPNTMQKAFAVLEQEGIVYSKRTSGRFVTDNTQLIDAMSQDEAQTIVRECYQKLVLIGMNESDMIELFRREVEDSESN